MSSAPETAVTWQQDTDPRDRMSELSTHLNGRVLGQPALIERMLISLLADGHMLVEGAPGLETHSMCAEHERARVRNDPGAPQAFLLHQNHFALIGFALANLDRFHLGYLYVRL